ncbi:hypothetical protein [Vibrio gallaecicus]|uniref:hypothetical protein n=1 Tax=Vibrio gallaecicus TaxID=552386 RepID=UPI0025B2E3D1|nr:hypothetical protein [Vibrio gallaecicus]MDN3617203.1 hypothetical protein [Vibrio gallaecicus]
MALSLRSSITKRRSHLNAALWRIVDFSSSRKDKWNISLVQSSSTQSSKVEPDEKSFGTSI